MNNNNVRIMFVTNSLSGGGAERATNVLVNALSEIGAAIALVAINDGSRDLVEPKCETFELKREWQGGILSVLMAYGRLQKTIWTWKPDFLVLNCDMPELIGSITIGRHKLIVVEHASRPWPNRNVIGCLVRNLLNARRTIWIAVSNHLKIWGLGTLPNFVINNPIGLVKNNYKDCENQEVNEIRRLVFIGRLSPEKDPSLLVFIAKKLQLPIMFIGSGVLSEQLEKKCKQEGVTAEFKGFLKDPWLEITSGDLLVVPSKNEGDGLVLVEAIQRKVPVLVKDIPDLARFCLPRENYFASLTDLERIIIASKLNINQFIISSEISNEVMRERNPRNIAEKWMRVFLENTNYKS